MTALILVHSPLALHISLRVPHARQVRWQDTTLEGLALALLPHVGAELTYATPDGQTALGLNPRSGVRTGARIC